MLNKFCLFVCLKLYSLLEDMKEIMCCVFNVSDYVGANKVVCLTEKTV